ncbi:uncharacterized protein JCM6883_001730, partial [Sporobolomyces salmoneus]|uniref:uncharacterized protein n=1 Tax=Sporobolomyces salmoneus TaxID=183962 RepID=UPI0031708F25
DSTSQDSPTSPSTTCSIDSETAPASASSPSTSIGSLSIVVHSPVLSVKVGVLLDGDADYFTRAYTSKGRQGGRCAAIELKNNVERFIRKEFFANEKQIRIEVVAYSFFNMRGLSSFFGDDMATFAQGFNSSPYAFSMSDVGDIPQGADVALKSHLPFLLSTCDHVLFGGTHDNGYEEILAALATSGHRDKVILLRTTPFCAEKILMLGLEEVRFPLLFAERDLTERARRTSEYTGDQSKVGTSGQNGNPSTESTPRSYAKATSGTTVTTPQAGNYDFKPLIRLLLDRLSPPSSSSYPLRGSIAYELKCLPKPPLDFSLPKEFKKYSIAAEEKGLVKLGVGETEGTEWIKLAIPISQAKEYVKDYSAPLSSSSQPGAMEGQPSFCVLVQVLRAEPDCWATFSLVSSKMVDRGARPWGNESFSKYAEKAVQARIVETGQIEGEKFEFWIQLTPQYRPIPSSPHSPPATRQPRSSSSSSSLTVSPSSLSSSSNPIPLKFVPLVRAFLNNRIMNTTPHSLASRLTCHGNKPFESGKWVEYLEEAKREGIVRLSNVGGGIQWVTLLRTR